MIIGHWRNPTLLMKWLHLFKSKVTLVPTGIKCKMPKDVYLELSVRSSTPLKHWIIMGNSVGKLEIH